MSIWYYISRQNALSFNICIITLMQEMFTNNIYDNICVPKIYPPKCCIVIVSTVIYITLHKNMLIIIKPLAKSSLRKQLLQKKVPFFSRHHKHEAGENCVHHLVLKIAKNVRTCLNVFIYGALLEPKFMP